jgi:recombinational DNA repair protein (RecF pathway)
MKCDRCEKEIQEDQVYVYKGNKLCEDCYLHLRLFPLSHTGPYRRVFSIKDTKRCE